ncbi:hypothetical protein BH10PAT3_BH10PAT3_8340 [soil metagenome]
MNTKLIAIFVAALIVFSGGAYAVGVSQGKGDKKATESAAMMKQKEEDTAMMKKDAESAAMKKQDEAAAVKKEEAAKAAEGDAMKKTDTTTPAQ